MTRMEFLEMLLAESQGAVSPLDASATPAVIPASLALPVPHGESQFGDEVMRLSILPEGNWHE